MFPPPGGGRRGPLFSGKFSNCQPYREKNPGSVRAAPPPPCGPPGTRNLPRSSEILAGHGLGFSRTGRGRRDGAVADRVGFAEVYVTKTRREAGAEKFRARPVARAARSSLPHAAHGADGEAGGVPERGRPGPSPHRRGPGPIRQRARRLREAPLPPAGPPDVARRRGWRATPACPGPRGSSARPSPLGRGSRSGAPAPGRSRPPAPRAGSA